MCRVFSGYVSWSLPHSYFVECIIMDQVVFSCPEMIRWCNANNFTTVFFSVGDMLTHNAWHHYPQRLSAVVILEDAKPVNSLTHHQVSVILPDVVSSRRVRRSAGAKCRSTNWAIISQIPCWFSEIQNKVLFVVLLIKIFHGCWEEPQCFLFCDAQLWGY